MGKRLPETESLLPKLYEAIRQRPGIKPSALTAQFQLGYRKRIYDLLPQMDDAGFLTYEDDRGGLYPWV